MDLWLEMHATSLDNEAQLASGWYDVDLSPTGEQQARELADRRQNEGFATVYCSTLRRSYRTAEIAFKDTSVPIRCDERLRECDYGRLTRAPVFVVERLRTSAVDSPFPFGESYAEVTKRVAAWLGDARRAHIATPILVIGHRGVFYALEHLCNGMPLRDIVAAPWQWQPGWRYHV